MPAYPPDSGSSVSGGCFAEARVSWAVKVVWEHVHRSGFPRGSDELYS